ncbi:MAG: restriction endonuclease subunit S, partial [Methylotenera sp.]
MNAHPTSWLLTKLGDVVQYGVTEKAEPYDIKPNTWVLELEDIEKGTAKVLHYSNFSERQSRSNKNRFNAGDVLYGKLRPYLSKVVYADRSGVCTTEIVPIKPNDVVNGRYLFHWLRHPQFLAYVTEVSHGVNMPRLGTEAGRQAPFVLAPKNEQKRIADKLDSLLARVNTVKPRIAGIAPILKRFRQSVLASATSGRLTEDWRLSNAQLLTQARVDLNVIKSMQIGKIRVRGDAARVDKERLFAIPLTWDWVLNHELARDDANAICAGPFGTIFKAKDFREKGVPIIFLRHVGEGRYLTRKPEFMATDVWKMHHQPYSVTGGELLVTKLGDPPGTACIYP